MNTIISLSHPVVMEPETLLYFDFRLHNTEDGNQVIQTGCKTFVDDIPVLQMPEYLTVYEMLLSQQRLQRKHDRNIRNKFLWKIACLCGMI